MVTGLLAPSNVVTALLLSIVSLYCSNGLTVLCCVYFKLNKKCLIVSLLSSGKVAYSNRFSLNRWCKFCAFAYHFTS
jgi:hypothetical protein